MYLFLPNDVNYLGPVFDPIFIATGANNDSSDPDNIVYFGDYFMTMLVCLDQFQFCNPLNGRCTANTHHIQAWEQGLRDLGLNDQQMAVLWRVEKMFISTFTYNAGIGSLGATGELCPSHDSITPKSETHSYLETGLLANEALFKGMLSPALPSDQWIREVRLWFETALSMLQDLTLGFLDISGFNNTQGAFQVTPVKNRSPSDREAAEWQCTGQKVRSRGQVQNFNVTGLIIIVGISTIIILVGLLLEPCVGVFRAIWKRPAGQLRQFARATDNRFWLLHAGLRGQGAYQWKYGSHDHVRGKEVPIIDGGLYFAPPVNDDGSRAPFYRIAHPQTSPPESPYDHSGAVRQSSVAGKGESPSSYMYSRL